MNSETQQKTSLSTASVSVLTSANAGRSSVVLRNRHPARGFTRLELIVVISIMSVVGAMAVPAVLSTTRYRKVNAAMLAASGAIQSARYLSLSKGVPYKITFTAATGTYQIFQCNNCAASIYTPTSTFTYGAADVPLDHAIPFTAAGGAALGADATMYFRPGGGIIWPTDTHPPNCATPLTMTFTYQGVSKNLTVECYGRVTVGQ